MRRAKQLATVVLALTLCGCIASREPELKKTVARFSGNQPAVTQFFEMDAGSARFEYSHDGRTDCCSNFVVKLLDYEGQYHGDLIANEIGDCSGSTVIRIRESGKYKLLIDLADGDWSITVKQ